ncbi:hypothetical protein H0X48_00105 [Candidatus Dependentiae bacterium]|nr:hypothetical protein [Candidatus Dependentiae bacterium]
MSIRNDISRIIIELPKDQHKKLKARAAILGKSMREIVLESLELTQECMYSDHSPNVETQKSIQNIEEGKNLTEYTSLEDLSKKLGF